MNYFQRIQQMNMHDIRGIAKRHNIKSARLGKIQLVQAIQQYEGSFDCFAKASEGYCDQLDCLWRVDCFESAKKSRQ